MIAGAISLGLTMGCKFLPAYLGSMKVPASVQQWDGGVLNPLQPRATLGEPRGCKCF
jgi:hypothetical protein